MNGSELGALRRRFQLSAEDLAREIGTSPHAILHIEQRKSVSVTTSARYAVAAFRLASRDVVKHQALEAELRETAQGLLLNADALKR
jgi:DNA-binding XRE family transcriptional regulator